MKAAAAPVPFARRAAAAVAGVAASALLAWGAWLGYDAAVSLPVERVLYAGDLERLSKVELDALAQAIRAAPGAPLEAVRASARRVPWVRDATVRRIFPDAVEVTFSAHTALARWNDAQLVNASGELFAAPGAGRLPQLRGPDAAALDVVRDFLAVSEALEPVGEVTEFRLSPRGAYHAVLDSGLLLALGRGDWEARAKRFAAAWPKLAPEARASTYADLRYPGGFALKRAAAVTLPATPTLPLAPSRGRGKAE